MTKQFSNYSDLLTFTRASKGHALRPVSYGTELVTNGTFDSDLSDWYAASNGSRGNITWTNETVVVDNSISNYNGAVQSITTEVGKIYKFEAEFVAFTGTSNNCALAVTNIATGTGAYASNSSLSIGVNQVIFVAQQTTTYIVVTAGTSTDATYDNVSVKEVLFDQPDGTLTLFEHPDNVPRVEYDADGNRLGLLVEESRTNLVTYSEDFSQWNGSSDPNEIIAPDGTLTATKIRDNNQGSNATVTLVEPVTVSTSTTHTYSVFGKKGQLNWMALGVIAFTTPSNARVWFDLDNGVVGTQGPSLSGAIEEFPNGWYRCSVTFTTDASDTSGQLYIYVCENDGEFLNTARDGTSDLYIWGAQLEAGSFPTSYIKTTGATATRSADVASIPVADFGFNKGEGTALVECTLQKQTVSNLRILGGTSTTRWLYVNSPDDDYPIVFYDGTNNLIINPNVTSLTVKAAISVEADSVTGSVNGSTPITRTHNGNLLGITSFEIFGNNTGHIKAIKYYPRSLTNAQLEALTEPRSTPTLSLTFDGLESSYTENYIHG